MIHFACSACHRTFKAPDNFAGKASKCPGCGTIVRVPAGDSQGTTLHPQAVTPSPSLVVAVSPVRKPQGAAFWLACVAAASLLSCLCGGGATAVIVGSVKVPGISGGPTIGDVVQHLKKNGVKGEYFRQPDDPFGIGGEDGGSFIGGDVELIIRQFNDHSRAKSLEKSGAGGLSCLRFGGVVVFVRNGENTVLPILKKL